MRGEILRYFGGQPLLKGTDPLLWWKGNEAQHLAVLAKSFLCVPATSRQSGHLFSTAGSIVCMKRESLNPEHADILTLQHMSNGAVFELNTVVYYTLNMLHY